MPLEIYGIMIFFFPVLLHYGSDKGYVSFYYMSVTKSLALKPYCTYWIRTVS